MVVATVHGGLVAAVVLAVRTLVFALSLPFGTVDLWTRWFLYLAPVQTHAQSTVILFAAVAPVVVRISVCRVEPASVFGQMQLCYFMVLVLITALFLDTLVFFTISSAMQG